MIQRSVQYVHTPILSSYSQMAGLKIVLHDFDQIVKKHLNIQNDHESKKYISISSIFSICRRKSSFLFF